MEGTPIFKNPLSGATYVDTPDWKRLWHEHWGTKTAFLVTGLLLGTGHKKIPKRVKQAGLIAAAGFTTGYVVWEIFEGVVAQRGHVPDTAQVVDGYLDLGMCLAAGYLLASVIIALQQSFRAE